MKKIVNAFIIIIFSLSIFFSVLFSDSLKDSIYDSIIFCGENLIPSLLPMMFIASLIINSGIIYTLPPKAIGLFLFALSSVCGYPSTATIFGALYKTGIIDDIKTKKLISSTVCAGPAFIINFVGSVIFNSKKLGIMLYISLLISNFIVFVYNGGIKLHLDSTKLTFKKNQLTTSVKGTLDSIANICGYVIIFSALSKIISVCFGKKISVLFLCISEVTGAISTINNIYIACAVLSFGGLCVFMQIVAIGDNIDFSLLKYLITRLFCCIFSVIILRITFIILPKTLLTYSNINTSIIISLNNSKAYFITMIITIITLLSSLKKSSSGKFLKDIDVI